MARYTEPITDLIKRRKSWRSFREEILSAGHAGQIRDFISSLEHPPFGTSLRFELVDSNIPDKKRMPGTYGVVNGAKSMLVGAMKPAPAMDYEDFGYSFESIILFCTQLGLGTCWMGGTCNRTLFGAMIGLESGEMIPAVSPVGYATESRTLLDSIFAIGVGSKNRKPFHELFFAGDLSTPLDAGNAGGFGEALEMVRLAPSATNRQPWRIVRKDGCFHFFLARTSGYKNLMGQVDLQRIDIGIAMCHFEYTAGYLGLAGHWEKMDGTHGITIPRGFEYRVSWVV